MCFVYEGNNLANPVPTKERKNVTQKQYGGQTENMQRWTSVVYLIIGLTTGGVELLKRGHFII